MQVLDLLKKHFARLGIDEFSRLNPKGVILTIIFGILTVSTIVPIFKLKTMAEISISFYVTSSAFCLVWMYLKFMGQAPTIYSLLDKFEEIIEKRE